MTTEEAAEVAAALISDRAVPFELADTPDETETEEATDSLETPRPAPPKSSSETPIPSAPKPGPSIGRSLRGAIDTEQMPETAAEAISRRGKVGLTYDAQAWADRLGISVSDISEICEDPDDEWLSDNAEVFYLIGRGVGLTVSTHDGAILAVRRESSMSRFRPRDEFRRPGIPRGRGGVGNRYPNDEKELRKLLIARGFEVVTVASGHQRISKDGNSKSISSTPGEGRTVINEAKAIEREFGVSLVKSSGKTRKRRKS